MKTIIILFALVPLVLFLASCRENLSSLMLIQEQSTGDFKVSVLSYDGTIKEGSGSFTVEFRNLSDSELVKVIDVNCQAQMQMRGNPMIGETTISMTDIPGRYKVQYNFAMKGSWLFTISFNDRFTVQFTVNVS